MQEGVVGGGGASKEIYKLTAFKFLAYPSWLWEGGAS